MLTGKPHRVVRPAQIIEYDVSRLEDREIVSSPMTVSHPKMAAVTEAPGSRMVGPVIVFVLALGASLLVLSVQRGLLLGQIAAVVITPLAMFGLLRGGIRKTAMLAAFFGAAYMAAFLPPLLTPLLQGVAGTSASAVSYLATGLAVIAGLVAVLIMSKAVRRKAARYPILSAVDGLAGAVVGGAEGALAVLALCWVSTSIEPHAIRLRDQGAAPVGSVQYEFATGVIRLAREASADPLGQYIRETNPINNVPALRQAVDSLNRTGQMQFDGLDPQIMEQIRKLLQSGGGDEKSDTSGTMNSYKESLRSRNSAYQQMPQPGE